MYKERVFAFHGHHPFRLAWNLLISVLLLYTGTWFIFHMCFIDFRIDPRCLSEADLLAQGESGKSKDDELSERVDLFVTIIFWIDLFLNFFFTYEDDKGEEVTDLRLMAEHYLTGFFAVNLIACIPSELIAAFLGLFSKDLVNGDTANQALRMLRMERISRVARVIRLGRMGKVKALQHSKIFDVLHKYKGVRIMKLVCFLLWIIHVLACGWYTVAAMHSEPCTTWVAGRPSPEANTNPDDPTATLLHSPPLDQWLTSMYFVLTVFTTVGFGDMSASTNGEIFYVCFVMALGAVVHSIVISEVISVVTSRNISSVFVQHKSELVDGFAESTMLAGEAHYELQKFVRLHAGKWMAENYDKVEMEELLVGESLPRHLMARIPDALFKGKLIKSSFFRTRFETTPPPRLPLLLGLHVHQQFYKAGDHVYEACEYAMSLHFVLDGVFAFVATPSDRGGQVFFSNVPQKKRGRKDADPADLNVAVDAAVAEPVIEEHPFQLFVSSMYFGDVELLLNRPRMVSARCETATGTTLKLDKGDFQKMADEFPHYGASWRSTAINRANWLVKKQKTLTVARTYENLAAHYIQQSFRDRQERRRLRAAGGANSSHTTPAKQVASTEGAHSEEVPVGPSLDKISVSRGHKSKAQQRLEMFQRLENLEQDIAEIVKRLGIQNQEAVV